MIELKRIGRFETDKGIISQFQLDIKDRFNYNIKTIISKDDIELKYQYTDLSGYITIYGEDLEEIMNRMAEQQAGKSDNYFVV